MIIRYIVSVLQRRLMDIRSSSTFGCGNLREAFDDRIYFYAGTPPFFNVVHTNVDKYMSYRAYA